MHDVGLGELLRRHREKAGLTQTQLANRLNVSQSQVSRWERGKSAPDAEHLRTLSELFGVPLGTLAERRLDMATPFERAVVEDRHLNRKEQDSLLAAYGVLTGRDSMTWASLLRTDVERRPTAGPQRTSQLN